MTRSRHGETGFLARPPAHLDAESVDAVVALKFRLGALLKAERVLVDWSRTETNWAHAGQAHRIGPYALHSDYQRANLTVAGPDIYCTLDEVGYREVSTVYAASGMSAVSAVLSAIGRVWPGARVAAPAGAYGETLEAIAACGIGIEPDLTPADRRSVGATGRHRVLLIDSFAPG